MSSDNNELSFASIEETKLAIEKLRSIDTSDMLASVLEMPKQIAEALGKSSEFNEGDIPLDRSKIHLVGLGGSAIAGELMMDMLAPVHSISIHRGTKPPRDKRGVIVSSYSGNTSEILELSGLVTGGLRTVVYFTSGGKLETLGAENSIPVWKMPDGYQPRAAVGWSLSYVASILERWRVSTGTQNKLLLAAKRLSESLERGNWEEHPLVRAALPISHELYNRNGVIFHSLRCTGAARRLAAQITENSHQAAFAMVLPEAMHNAVEGIGGSSPDKWTLIFVSDPSDPPSLRSLIIRSIDYFSTLGFKCLQLPSAGKDQFELTLSRLFLSDIISLFLAAKIGVDPTPLRIIPKLKPPLEG